MPTITIVFNLNPTTTLSADKEGTDLSTAPYKHEHWQPELLDATNLFTVAMLADDWIAIMMNYGEMRKQVQSANAIPRLGDDS
jgi:hypothetical protein